MSLSEINRANVIAKYVIALLLSLAAMLGLASPAAAQEPQPAAARTLAYSSYLGGAITEEGRGVTIDQAGNIYVIGQTQSNNFLGSSHTVSGYSDIFVAKFNPAGTNLLYLTFMGSSGSDYPLAVKVDNQGNAYATGMVFDDDFPTHNALWPAPPEYSHNGIIFKLNPNGAVVYSTFLPLDVFDAPHNLAVDSAGNAYVTGTTFRTDGSSNQIVLLKLNPNGSQLLLERYLGGPDAEKGTAITLDAAGNIYLTGTSEGGDEFPVTTNAHQSVCGDIFYDPMTFCYRDGVVIVLNSAGQVTYSSYHGGSFTDQPLAIATDGQGHILIAGNTTSGKFPLVKPVLGNCPLDSSTGDCVSPRGFVSMIHLAGGGSSLAYSTYLASNESDSTNVVLAAAMDSAGNGYVTGYTNGRQFPRVAPLQAALSESFCHTFGSQRYCFDGFISQFTPAGTLAFSSYLGATFDEYPYDVTVDNNSNIYLTGLTEADNFPVTTTAFQPANQLGDDAFLVKIGQGGSEPGPGPGPGPAPGPVVPQALLPLIIR